MSANIDIDHESDVHSNIDESKVGELGLSLHENSDDYANREDYSNTFTEKVSGKPIFKATKLC